MTNDYIDTNATGMILVENKAVAGMASAYRDQLGDELCLRCQAIWDEVNDCLGDKGYRIKALVEAGAELSIKKCRGGNTAFMALLQSSFGEQEDGLKYDLLNYFMVHEVPVSLINDERKGCVDIADEILSSGEESLGVAYRRLLNQIIDKCDEETELIRVKSEARDEENNEHRERQRVLADNAQNANSRQNNEVIISDALGTMSEGWGYFPCMTALLFQGNVPSPPSTFAEDEKELNKELNFILRSTLFLVTSFWLLC